MTTVVVSTHSLSTDVVNITSQLLPTLSLSQHSRLYLNNQLSVPRVHHSMFGSRAFSVAGPTVWNSPSDSFIHSFYSLKKSWQTQLMTKIIYNIILDNTFHFPNHIIIIMWTDGILLCEVCYLMNAVFVCLTDTVKHWCYSDCVYVFSHKLISFK